jgi:hypothetical protein
MRLLRLEIEPQPEQQMLQVEPARQYQFQHPSRLIALGAAPSE